jgi:hypothetical protein
MSLQSWLQNSWLVQHTTSPDEIKNLLAISDRDLLACQVKQLPADWRCTIAYNAALQAAIAALAAAGYRATRDNHHYRVIQSLEFTTAPGRKFVDTLDGFRKKRNVSSYDVAGPCRTKKQTRCSNSRPASARTWKGGSERRARNYLSLRPSGAAYPAKCSRAGRTCYTCETLSLICIFRLSGESYGSETKGRRADNIR